MIANETGKKTREAINYSNLGTLFQELGKYAEAEEYYKKSLEIRKEIGDKQVEAADYGKLGTVLQCLGEYAKAEEYLQKALVITKKRGDKKRRSSILRKPRSHVSTSW